MGYSLSNCHLQSFTKKQTKKQPSIDCTICIPVGSPSPPLCPKTSVTLGWACMTPYRHTASNTAHSCAPFCFRLHCANPRINSSFPTWTHIENNPHGAVRLQPLTESPWNKRAASVISHSKGDKIVHCLPGGPNSPSATETLVMRLCCITRYVTPRHWLLSLFIRLDAKGKKRSKRK